MAIEMKLETVVVVATLVSMCSCQQACPFPTNDNIEQVLVDIIRTGDSSSVPAVNVTNMRTVCRAFDTQQYLLRLVSVVVQYSCSGHANCPSGTATEQIETGCVNGQWDNNVQGSNDNIRSMTTEAGLTTGTRDNCSTCVSPELAPNVGLPTPDSATHCIACSSSCDKGLTRCTGFGSDDCCSFYHNSECVDECPSPFMTNSEYVCVCPVGTTGINCEDDVVCATDDLGTIENGIVTVFDTVFNSSATYSCNTGYNLAGDATRTCLGTGLWSGSIPTCELLDCGALNNPENGIVTVSETTFNSLATYSCNTGYELRGNAVRTCLASGQWSGGTPMCTIVDCGALADPANGMVTLVADAVFNSSGTYSCNTGYSLMGDAIRICLSSGLWSGSGPTCELVDCGALNNPENGIVTVSETTFNSSATYSCNTGYNLTGDAMRMCLANGLWSSSTPTCTIFDCGALEDPTNGMVIVSDTVFNSMATYSCTTGYSLMGDAMRICLSNGLWSESEPICELVDCGALADPDNGIVTVSEITFNSSAPYSCNTGYELRGNAVRTCLASGLWSGGTPMCTIVDCGALADPVNGIVTESDTVFNSSATYSCNTGYSLMGDAIRICLSSGLWSGSGPTCELVDCGALADPDNGIVTVTETTFNSSATYSCNTGYELRGNAVRTCLASGLWSGGTPMCTIVDCGALADPVNGIVTESDTVFNSSATYSCNTGYSLMGDAIRICLSSGLWSGSGPTCELVNCGALADPDNGIVMVSETTFNSSATYSCNTGYELRGDAVRTCLGSGQWSSGTPMCTIVDCGALQDPKNGMVTVSDTVFNSMATYSCNTGYSLMGDAMRMCQSSGLWSGSETACERFGIGSDCAIITTADMERVLSSYVGEPGCSDPMGCAPVISAEDVYINCLAPGRIRDTYTHASVTVHYQRSDETSAIVYLAQADIGCSNLTGNWEANILRSLASGVEQVFNFGSGTTDGITMRSYSACLSPSLAVDLSMISDANYHCVGCDDSCTGTGLGQCYGPSHSECCSYYSSDMCVDDCGSRREFDENWQCVCAGGWREPNCTVCDLTCENGGLPDLVKCISCDCQSGYTGSKCEADIDECSLPGSCSSGLCTNTFGGYSCTCVEGYTGRSCDVNIDECLNHDCQNGASCVDGVAGYLCVCRDGSSGDKCDECDIFNCQECNFILDPIQCNQCDPGYARDTNGACECDLENCVECSVGTPPKCQKCETDYVLEDGVCSGKDGATTREPTTSATTSDGGSNTNDKGLTDFEIAAILAGVLIFIILLIVLLTGIAVHVAKRLCKSKEPPTKKVNAGRRAKSNLAYTQNVVYGVVAKSQQLEAQVILGAEEETTEMIGEGGSGEEGGEWEGEVSKEGEEELGDDGFGDDEVSPLSRV